MKLVNKLTLALIAGTSLVLTANGYLRVRREVALFESDRVRDHKLVGIALGAAFAAVWHAEGEDHAMRMLAQVNERQDKLRVRYLGADPEGQKPDTFFQTYVPIEGGGAPPGGLVISESHPGERAYVRTTVITTAITTAVLGALIAAISAGLGAWFVGRPMRSLMDKARRVGQGDFSGELLLRQRDELADLATEMNAMCDRLIEAHQRSAAEGTARIAALEQLRHADRLMTVGKLASGVAHELGTPLNVVSARAGMIADGETTTAESVDYARIIGQACDQMTQIIRQLLDFARPRGPERAAEDVRRIVERTLSLLEPLAAKKSVTMTLKAPLPGAAPVIAELDAGQMQQVFTNLVVNAVHAMEAQGTVLMTVSHERAVAPAGLLPGLRSAEPSSALGPGHGGCEISCVCVRVRDDGSGILPEHLAHVFEPFFTTKDVGQGTGLGLSVAYGIVREHRGWMDVQSTLGQGSEFAVYLPVTMGETPKPPAQPVKEAK